MWITQRGGIFTQEGKDAFMLVVGKPWILPGFDKRTGTGRGRRWMEVQILHQDDGIDGNFIQNDYLGPLIIAEGNWSQVSKSVQFIRIDHKPAVRLGVGKLKGRTYMFFYYRVEGDHLKYQATIGILEQRDDPDTFQRWRGALKVIYTENED